MENKLRYDYVSLNKDTISRLFKSLSYSFGSILNYNIFILKGNYGTTFKNPGINDLFFPYMGNPDLKPERGKEFSMLVGLQMTGFNMNVSYFNKNIDDLIYWSGTSPKNINSVNINGIEGRMGISTKNIFLLANLTYQNSISHDIIDTTNIPITRKTPYSPTFKGSYTLKIKLPHGISICNSGIYTTSYVNYFKNYSSGGIDTVKTNNHFTINGNINIDLSDFNFIFAVNNILNYRGIKSFGYSEYDKGYPYDGRRLSFTISTSF